MNIKRVKYKMSANDDWKVGYVIGLYDGQNKMLQLCNQKIKIKKSHIAVI